MRRAFVAGLLAWTLVGCNSGNPPPTPAPGGGGAGETITGRERIGWDQAAASQEDLATFRYAIYVDDVRSEMSGVDCATIAGPAGFACSGQLPPMSPGSHVLELAAFTADGGILESPRSTQLRVNVTGATSPVAADPLTNGERISTQDGVQLDATLVAEALDDVSDMAVASDGSPVIAERGGAIVVLGQEPFSTSPTHTDGETLAIALAPDFTSSGHLFVVRSATGVSRLIRYRLRDQRLIERMPVLPDVPASADASVALRFGPDGSLYAAFDDGGNRDASLKRSDWRGKILRLNVDGSTPEDQPAASPVFWSGLARPKGMDWSPSAGSMWMIERGQDNVERLRAITTAGARPRRADQRTSYVLPGTVGATSLAFYKGDTIPGFEGNLFLTARDGGYLLRVQFDKEDRFRPVTTEKLLEGRLGPLSAVATTTDGALYIATRNSVWRLTPTR